MAKAIARQQSTQAQLQRYLVISIVTVAVMGGLHLIDHVIRGHQYVLPIVGPLNTWVLGAVSYLFILPPLYLTMRGRLLTGFWLFVGVVAGLLVGVGHLSPIAVEPVHSIYMDHAAVPWQGVLAVVILFAFFLSLLALIGTALYVRHETKANYS